MKNIFKYKYILYCTAILAVTASCMEDEQSYPDANKPVITSSVNTLNIEEDGDPATFTVNLSRAIGDPVDFKIEQTGGSATVEDYAFSIGELGESEIGPAGYQGTIPAGTTSFEVSISAPLDIFADQGDTATFRIVQGQNGNALVNGGEIEFTVNIQNSTSQTLFLLMDWDTDVTYQFLDGDGELDEIDEHLCDVVDFDLISYPSQSYLLGTADCPEILEDGGVLADGTYELMTDLYSVTTEEEPLAPFDIPYSLTIAQPGLFVATVSYANVYNSDSPVSAPPGNGPGLTLAATLVVENGSYTVYDMEGNLVTPE